ncbi:MAG: hypothetical protein J6U68_05080, partial [Clostridia bacterium]|nr:hypothetical protein [Clostridia bacterium]
MKMFLKLLSAFLIIATMFTMFAPSVAAQISIWQEEVNLNKDTESTYTREYTFNSDGKMAENDRILYEPGGWTTEYSSSFFDADNQSNSAYHDLRNTLKSNSKFQGFTSLGTVKDSWNWTIDTSDSNYVSIPSITQDHPRLLVTKDTIPTIRKALEEHTKTNDRFFELLDTTYDEVNYFKLTPMKDITYDSTDPEYDGRAGKHNYRKDYLEIIQIKALGYLVDGHKLYGYQAIQGMKNFLRTLEVENSAYYIKTNMEREHGNVAFTAALVFDWCYPLLNEDDKTQLMSAVQNIALKGTMPGNDEHKMH